MTAQVADFIASREGEMWGRYCAHYGEHPGDIFDDDVMRFQVGVAYMIRDRFKPEEQEQSFEDWVASQA